MSVADAQWLLQGCSSSQGILVEHLYPNSPAARAGLRPGDIILSFDGHPTGTSAQLIEA